MKISIKTLKGEQFEVEVDLDDEVGAVKIKVAAIRADMPASRQKLIHAGKVLKDDTTLRSSGVADNDFIVCMLTKEIAAKPTPAPAVVPAPVAVPAPTPISTPAVVPPALAATEPSTPQFEDPAAVQQLVDMGFPEAECRAALRAAFGNSGVAVEYLMSGIPPQAQQQQSSGFMPPPQAPVSSAGGSMDALRRHPQLNMLKRLVQENPAALGRVLEAIGQQSPELLQAIHADQPAFLALMNEPIVDDPVGSTSAGAGIPGLGGAGAAGGTRNPAELLQMLVGLPDEMRAQAAMSLGMTPEQLQGFTQMLSSLPPDQLQQMMAGADRGGGGQNIIRLTEEEMASVTRLTELGFDQQDAAAAYLACDKNEALAANLLLEGWQAGGDMDIGGDGNEDYGDGGDDMYS